MSSECPDAREKGPREREQDEREQRLRRRTSPREYRLIQLIQAGPMLGNRTSQALEALDQVDREFPR